MSGDFRTRRQRHVAALLSNRAMGVSELLDVVGGDRKSLTRQLERLKNKGLLDFVDAGHAAPGHPARLWSLSADGRDAAERVGVLGHGDTSRSQDTRTLSDDETSDLGEDDGPDLPRVPLHAGQILVNAALGGATREELRTLLAEGELGAAASWIAQFDGDGALYVFSFEPEVGNQPAENLVAALEALGATCTSGTVRAVSDARAFRDSLRAAEAARRRAREATAAIDRPPGT